MVVGGEVRAIYQGLLVVAGWGRCVKLIRRRGRHLALQTVACTMLVWLVS